MFYESHLSVTRTIGKLEIAIGGFGKNKYTRDGETTRFMNKR
jgi:hypothetical protein